MPKTTKELMCLKCNSIGFKKYDKVKDSEVVFYCPKCDKERIMYAEVLYKWYSQEEIDQLQKDVDAIMIWISYHKIVGSNYDVLYTLVKNLQNKFKELK